MELNGTEIRKGFSFSLKKPLGNLLAQFPTLQKCPILRVSEDVSVGLSLKMQQTPV